MSRVSATYTSGSGQFNVFASQSTVECTLSPTLSTLFSGGISDFDNSICLNFCTNNDRVNTTYRYSGYTENNCNISWDDVSGHERFDFYWSDNIPQDTVSFIGTVLLASTEQSTTNFPNGLFSLKRYLNGYGSHDAWDNLRFVLDVGGNGFNDIYAVFSGSDDGASNYTATDHYTTSDCAIKYCPNLMTRDITTIYANSNYINIRPYIVFMTNDEIYLGSITSLHPWACFFYYNGSYQIDNFNDFKANINKSTGADKTFTGAFGSDDAPYLDFIGKMDIPTEKTQAPLSSSTAYTISYKRYSSSSAYRDALWCLHKSLCDYNWNMIGLKWVRTEEFTSDETHTKMKLPYMDDFCSIDCESWVTGLTQIKQSDSKNVDMSFSHLPDINPAGKDQQDKYDQIGITLNGAGNSFCHWYGVTSSEMYSLLSAFYSASVPTGLNPLDHIIGVIQAPFDISTYCSGTGGTAIKIGTWDTGVTGFMLGNQGSNSFVNMGSYAIPRYHSNFMDYAPYTTISLYVPYCGTIDLPPSLFVGHTVSVQLMYDIFAGDCTAMIMRDGSYYTSIAGNFTSTVAISAENMGAIKQAIVNGCMGVIGGAVTGIGGFASGNVAVGIGGTAGMIGSFAKSTEEINGIAPTMRGVAGGRSMFYKPNKPIIYINTPVNKITDGYINTHGLPVMETKTLSAGNGFTVVDNPVVTGNMTQAERTAIVNMFKNGVIL